MEQYAPLLTSLLPFFVILAVFYFLLIRPQKKREQEVKSMRDALKVGDTVLTIGGIRGRLVEVKDDHVLLETSDEKTKLEFVKNAIAQVITE